jgi:hypothetical protein
MAQAVSHQTLSAKTWVYARVNVCGICGQNDTGIRIFQVLRFSLPVSFHRGRAFAQAVSVWPFTQEAQFRARFNPCGICGGQNDTGTDLVLVLPLSLVTTIPPWRDTHISPGHEPWLRSWSQCLQTFPNPIDMHNKIILLWPYIHSSA